MAPLPINIVSSVCDQVAAWQEAFLGEANLDRFRRAAAWTMSEVAKSAASGAKDAVEDAFENPTPWMRSAFGYNPLIAGHMHSLLYEEY